MKTLDVSPANQRCACSVESQQATSADVRIQGISKKYPPQKKTFWNIFTSVKSFAWNFAVMSVIHIHIYLSIFVHLSQLIHVSDIISCTIS